MIQKLAEEKKVVEKDRSERETELKKLRNDMDLFKNQTNAKQAFDKRQTEERIAFLKKEQEDILAQKQSEYESLLA